MAKKKHSAEGSESTETEAPEVPTEPATLGRIVHYLDANETWRAAIVSGLNEEEGSISLHVFLTPGSKPVERAHYSSAGEVGCWTWPERK